MTDTTHTSDCWDLGPRHYECAVREIEALRAEVERLEDALLMMEEREQRDEALLRQALEALEGVAQWVEKRPDTHPWDAWQRVEPAITAIRIALDATKPCCGRR